MTPEWVEDHRLCHHGEYKKHCLTCAAVRSWITEDDQKPEALIEAECSRLLEQDGWRALRTDPVSDRGRGTGFGELGMADYLYLRYETSYGAWETTPDILWVEYKSAKGKPAKHQVAWHTKERARGALTWIAGVDFPASVAGFVEHYRKSGLNRGRI